MNPPAPTDPPFPSTQQTNTGGGAYIAGNATSGADFVGRDKIVAETVNIYQSPPPVAAPPPPPNPQRQPRRGLLVGGALVALLLVALLVYNFTATAPRPCTDNRHCVLIAHFEPRDNELAAEIVRKISTELTAGNLLPTDQFNVQTIDALQGADQAQQLATQSQAQIIIWGQLFPQLQELKINFALTNQLGVGQSNQLRPYRVQAFAPLAQSLTCAGACFAADNLRQLLDQLSTVVAYTAAGMLQYGLDQPEAADQAFGVALYCSGGPVDPALVDLTNVACNQDLNIEGFSAGALYYYAGKAKILTGDYATALTYLEKAAAQSPTDPAPLIGIATLYQSWLDQGDMGLVTAALAEATRRTNTLRMELVNRNAPTAALAAVDYELGLIAELQRDWAGAERNYATAIEAFGPQSQAAYLTYIALGRVQRLAGKLDEADATLKQAHVLDPTVPWALLELAQLHQAERSIAEPLLASARAIAPNQAYVDIIEAQFCTIWAAFDCAAAAYQRAAAQRPNSGWLAGRIGDFYRPDAARLPHQDWAKAAEYYAMAVQQRPNDPWAHERLAFALYYQGEYAAAAEHFAVSLHDLSHPESQLAERYCNLAQVQLVAGAPAAALANAQLCREKLVNPAQRTAVDALITQIQAAQQGGQ